MIPLVTYFNDAYFPAYRTMVKSLLKNNITFTNEIWVFDWGISERNKDACLDLYKKTKFIQLTDSYDYINGDTLDRFYYILQLKKLEMFLLRDVDGIVCIDADMVVIGDITPMFDMVRPDKFYCDINIGENVPAYDTGIMVIGKDFLCDDFYNKCKELITREVNKDVSSDATCCTNEYIVSDVFGEYIEPIDTRFRASDITDISSRIIGTPEYKYWLDGGKYKRFSEKGLLPWDTSEEIEKSHKFVKYILVKGYV